MTTDKPKTTETTETSETAETVEITEAISGTGPAGHSFDTLQIHAGQEPDPATGSRALPIYQTTAFVFDDIEHAASLFDLSAPGHIYTRISNPTTQAVEDRLAALEGGVGALLVSSGQSATLLAILNIAEAGDQIVASPSLYGGTFNLFAHTLPKLGVQVDFVEDPADPQSWKDAVKPNTKAFFAEAIPNPKGDIFDIEPIADTAHEIGVPLIVDNTVTTPYLTKSFEWGADVVVAAATKFLSGHGTVMGGVIVDSGNFDYGKYPERFPGFNQPDPTYNGIVYAKDFGADGPLGVNASYITKVRVQLLRDFGCSIAPFNAFLLAQGLETLSLRMDRHVDNTQKVAEYLEDHPQALSVAYAGLPSSPYYELAQKYTPRGPGGILSFELAGGREAGEAFVSALKLHSHVTNIGDVRSLVTHPSSTTHSQLTEEEQAEAGVTPGLIRLGVGLEDITDILADLDLGFAAAAKIDPGAAEQTLVVEEVDEGESEQGHQ